MHHHCDQSRSPASPVPSSTRPPRAFWRPASSWWCPSALLGKPGQKCGRTSVLLEVSVAE